MRCKRKEYPLLLLGSFSNMKYGKMPKKDMVKENGKYPVFSGYRIVGYCDECNLDEQQLIVIARGVGGTGDVKLSPGACYLTNLSIAVIIDENIALKQYLFYYFQKHNLRYLDSGSAQSQITIADLKNIVLPIPPLEIQSKIVEIVSCLDDKIELNNKINENLERQAFELFDNFYNRTNSSVKFTEIIQIMGGGTPKTGESSYWNGQIPFFTPKDVGSPYTLTTEKWITEEGLAHCNSRLYPVNTVFVTARGTVGKAGMPGVPMAMNQSCYALVGKEIHQLLVYFYTLKTVDRLKHKASGAVFDAITTRDFESESISKLSDNDAEAFLSIAKPIYQAILSNAIENQRLVSLRDILLPKLMSGEIDVGDVNY